MSTVMCGILAVMMFTAGSPPPMPESNMPRSNQAVMMESTSPTEVMVQATGIGHWEKGVVTNYSREAYLLHDAEEDASKAAVWFVLFGGTDPLITTIGEKSAFDKIAEQFFAINNIQRFIAWEGTELISRTKREVEKKRRYELIIEKAYRINKQALTEALIKEGILTPREVISAAAGNPMIMVIPASRKGQSPIAILKNEPDFSHAAKVIEGFLTARRYEVIVPEQQEFLTELSSTQLTTGSGEIDNAYQLALSIGSDVYITFEVTVEGDKYNTRKASASIRAFETTTARLIGAETGYSKSAPSSSQALIEQAVNDAIDKVLNRITNYWREDYGKGVQYKVIFTIAPGIDRDVSESFAFGIGDILGSIAKNRRYKENIITDRTLDYLMWCDPARYDQSTQVYKEIKRDFMDRFKRYSVEKISINRKLILLSIDKEKD